MFILLPPFLGLLAVHVTITLPFCIGLLRASVQQMDRTLEDAAGSLGAGPGQQLPIPGRGRRDLLLAELVAPAITDHRGMGVQVGIDPDHQMVLRGSAHENPP